MKKHILEAQLTEETSTGDGATSSLAPVASLTVEACKCRHLQKWLPHVLDLSCAAVLKDDEPDDEHKETKWVMCNPVHALHMASHLEPDGATVFLPKEQAHGELALYGEEQCRSQALFTKGISPAVELITEQDETKLEYVTRRILPSHEPTLQQSMKAPSSTGVMSQPSTSSAAAPRRPPLPSGIVPPKGVPSLAPLKAPPLPQVNRSSGYMTTSPSVISNNSIKTTTTRSSASNLLSDERLEELRRKEHALVQQQQQSTGTNRRKALQTAAARKVKKKQKVDNPATVPLLPMLEKTLYQISNLEKWQQDAQLARATVEEWMERFRLNRRAYWQEKKTCRHCRHTRTFEFEGSAIPHVRECQVCSANPASSCGAVGDELMQCLECSFVGCGPQSLLEESGQHMMHHMILTGHNFGKMHGDSCIVVGQPTDAHSNA